MSVRTSSCPTLQFMPECPSLPRSVGRCHCSLPTRSNLAMNAVFIFDKAEQKALTVPSPIFSSMPQPSWAPWNGQEIAGGLLTKTCATTGARSGDLSFFPFLSSVLLSLSLHLYIFVQLCLFVSLYPSSFFLAFHTVPIPPLSCILICSIYVFRFF